MSVSHRPADARYIDLPIDVSSNLAVQTSEEEKKKLSRHKKFDIRKIIVMVAFNDKAQKVVKEMYPTLFFHPECQKQYAKFFREVLATENGAILYHCTQGKDRTGVASALLLAAWELTEKQLSLISTLLMQCMKPTLRNTLVEYAFWEVEKRR